MFLRKDGRWSAIVELDQEGTSRRRKTLYGKTKREVLQKLRQEQEAISKGLPSLPQRLTVGEFLDSWLEGAKASLKPSTAQSYGWIVEYYLKPYIGSKRLAKLSPEDVERMMRALAADGRSARTQQYARAVLRRALTIAARRGYVARNVASLTEPPRLERTERPTLSVEQARTLLDLLDGDRLEALYAVAVGTGLRQGESLALRWQDVDVNAGTLTVSGTLRRQPEEGGGSRLVRSEPKTARSRRTIPVPDYVADALRAHKARQDAERAAAGKRWRDLGYVFCTPLGTPLEARNVTRHWHRLRERAGLPGGMHWHDLRHSAATIMLEAGVPLAVISRTLGHAGLAITADIYAHVGERLQRDAAEAMHGALSRSPVDSQTDSHTVENGSAAPISETQESTA